MNETLKRTWNNLIRFLGKKRNRCLLYLIAICLFAFGDFLLLGLVRRTFVFYSGIEGNAVVENRMLRRAEDRETDIRRYVDDALLGPVSRDLALLFPYGTRLESFMYRDAVVYADLSQEAALPLPEGSDVFRSLFTLNEGIRRNFPFVKNVRIFIGGNEVFFEEFRGIFSNPADNSKTAL